MWSASSAGLSLRKAFNSSCEEVCRDKLGSAAAECMVPGTPGQGVTSVSLSCHTWLPSCSQAWRCQLRSDRAEMEAEAFCPGGGAEANMSPGKSGFFIFFLLYPLATLYSLCVGLVITWHKLQLLCFSPVTFLAGCSPSEP